MGMKNYETAKTCFQAALKYNPNDASALNKIEQCNNELSISEQKQIENECNQKIKQGDWAYSQKHYEAAKSFYRTGIAVKTESISYSNKN